MSIHCCITLNLSKSVEMNASDVRVGHTSGVRSASIDDHDAALKLMHFGDDDCYPAKATKTVD